MIWMEGIPSFPNIEQQLLLEVLDGVTRVKYLAVASSALLCYDYALTFDQEVYVFLHIPWHEANHLDQQLDYFWSGPWSKSRVLFLAVCALLFSLELFSNYPCVSEPLLSTDNHDVSNTARRKVRWKLIMAISFTLICEFCSQLLHKLGSNQETGLFAPNLTITVRILFVLLYRN